MNILTFGYEHIQIAPFKLQELVKLEVVRKINEHTRLIFTGIVPDSQKDSYKVKSRSFQNGTMTYTEMFQAVIADYSGADFKDIASRGATLGTFAIQYRMTDWQYLKQKASLFNVGLIPADTYDKPKFYIGIPDEDSKGELDNYHYSVRKNLRQFKTVSVNHNASLQEADFIYYEVETGQILNLGDQINFKGKPLYVYEAVSLMEKSQLKNRYLLAPKGGLSQNTIYNPVLIGASIQGRVIAVSKDNVRVHLEIDKEQKEAEAFWFPYTSVYTAEGNSGWYCMPEVGDQVRIYFSEYSEANAAAVSSVRRDSSEGKNNKVTNPDVKYFRTKFGKELMFSPTEIVITGKDGEVFIRLNDNDGIELYSKQGVKIISKEDVTIESDQKVNITAKEAITMNCKDSDLKMDGNTVIKGYEIKSN